MNELKIKTTWNELITNVKQWFADLVDDDMLFSEAKEMRLIRQLRRRLEKSQMRIYNH